MGQVGKDEAKITVVVVFRIRVGQLSRARSRKFGIFRAGWCDLTEFSNKFVSVEDLDRVKRAGVSRCLASSQDQTFPRNLSARSAKRSALSRVYSELTYF